MIKNRILLFNKPYGVPSTFTDELGRETLKAYIPVEGVYAAGRLDLDSEGLLVLTDDGELIHRLTEPGHHLPKTYMVQVEGEPSPATVAQLQLGVDIQGYHTKRCRVMTISEPNLPPRTKPITPHGPTNWLQIELEEGKKRQIRHMTAAVGLPTLRLVRVAIGPLSLGELKPGQWREIGPDERKRLMQALQTKR
jgi:23S rRNA pseudouridine2457 synthase